MKWNEHVEKLCPIAKTLGVIGEYWTLLILRNSFLGTRRFDEFQEQLGMTRHVLADRLKMLVENEVLKKVPYGEKAGRFEYRLTEKGRGLYPIILSIADWGNTWLFEEGEQPLQYTHTTCGEHTKPVMSCSSCGEALKAREVKVSAAAPLVKLAKSKEANALVKELGYRPPA